jgi:general secretion pathway protein A
MYLEFFKFRKNPFHITPDPEFLFLSSSHKEASASILYGIEERKGFIALTGEVGVGKTTILRSYLEGTDPERTKIVYIFNAAVTFQKLLRQIFLELGIPLKEDESPELEILFHFLIKEYEKDCNVVLIVDEAQNMPVETLEHLRMLSNLETSQDKLLQIVLVGQPEFETKLNLPELRQLKQRVAIRCRIGPLSSEESRAYIEHRLFRASSFHNPVFTKNAMKRLIRESQGIPRVLNVLCDNALITAFGYQRKPVDAKIVREVIVDFQGRGPRRSWIWRMVWAATLALIFGLAFFIFNREGLAPNEKTSISMGPVAPADSTKPVESVKTAPPPAAPAAGQNAGTGEDIVPRIETEPPVPPVPDDNAPDSSTAKEPPKVADAPSPPPAVDQVPRGPEKAAKEILATEQEPNAPKQTSTTRVVKRGDSVFKLLTESYGRLDPKLVQIFKELNPQIQDINRVRPGEELLLPQPGKTQPASN